VFVHLDRMDEETRMGTVQRVTRNAVLLNVARIISTLGKFFLLIYVARVLGEAVLGQFTFAIIFTSFFAIVISLGMDDLLVREVARDTNASRKYLGNIAVLRLLLSLAVMVVIVISINVMNYPADTRLAVYIFGGYIVFTAFSFMFRANFRAFERMEWDALLEAMEAVVTTVVGLIVILSGYGLVALSLTFLGASILSAAIAFIVSAWKFTLPRIEVDWEFWKTTVMKAVPFSVFALFILYPRVDTILLSTLKGDAVVGEYNAAYQIVIAFSPLVMNFMIALVPLLSRYFVSGQTMLTFAYEKSVKYLVMVGFPTSMGAMVLAPRIIPFLYGDGYGNSVLALQILAWNCVLLAMSRPMFYVLGAINRQGTCAVITLAAFALAIGMNYLVIPAWSYVGSGATTLVTGVFVAAAAWYATSRYGFPLRLPRLIVKPMIASLAMGAVLYLTTALADINLVLLIAIGTVSYLASLYLVRGFSSDDWFLLRQALRIRSKAQPAQPPEARASDLEPESVR